MRMVAQSFLSPLIIVIIYKPTQHFCGFLENVLSNEIIKYKLTLNAGLLNKNKYIFRVTLSTLYNRL